MKKAAESPPKLYLFPITTMIIHLSPVFGLVLAASLIVGFSVHRIVQAKPQNLTPIEQECIKQGIDPELSSKCEHPFS